MAGGSGRGKALKSLEVDKKKTNMHLFLLSLHVNSHVSSLPLCCISTVAAGLGPVPQGSRAERASGPRRSVTAAVHLHRFTSQNPKLMFH